MSLALGPAFGTPLGGLLRALWRPNAAGALVPALAVPLFMPRAPAWTVRLPSLLDALWDLFPPVLRAVPKKKVSHSRKAMRSANKGLKDKFSACAAAHLWRAPADGRVRGASQTSYTARRAARQSWPTTSVRAASRKSVARGSVPAQNCSGAPAGRRHRRGTSLFLPHAF
jgi:ribosomal protein L32